MSSQKTTFNQADKKWLKKNFITKGDVKDFATKKDLKNLLTKDDAKNFLTRSDKDINSIKGLITVAVDDAIEKKQLVTKNDISHLPTKDDFFKETSKLFKKMEDIETDLKLVTEKVSEHSDDIEELKKNSKFRHAN
jgi:hypothetical protein